VEVARKVAKNTFYNFTALVVGNLSGLFLAILLARILKPENFGIYSLALVIANLSIALSTLGIDNAVVRYISFYHGRNDINALRSHFKHFLKVKMVVTVIVASSLILLSGILASTFGDERLRIPFFLAGTVVFLASISNLFASFSRGLQRFDLVFLRQVTYEFSRWVFVIPLAISFLAVGAVAGVALAYAVSALTLFYFISKNYHEFIFGKSSKVSGGVHSYMGFMTIASLSGIVYAHIDSIMIGYLIDSTHVGFYRAAYTVVFAISGFASSLAGVLLPTFTQLSEREFEAGLGRLNRYVSIIVFPIAILLSFFADQIVYVLYGRDYSVAGDVMTILAFALIPSGFVYLGSTLNAKERADLRAYTVLAGMIMNVILNYILIIRMGMVGAAIATVISRFFVIFAVVFALAKLLRMNPKVDAMIKPLLASTLIVLLILVLPKPGNLFSSILEIVSLLSLYVVLLVVVKCLGVEDIKYFKKIIRV